MPEDFFDFKQISEEQESLDYDHLKDCPHCKKPIPQDATLCYYCGKDVYFGKKSNWGFWLILLSLIFLLLFFLF